VNSTRVGAPHPSPSHSHESATREEGTSSSMRPSSTTWRPWKRDVSRNDPPGAPSNRSTWATHLSIPGAVEMRGQRSEEARGTWARTEIGSSAPHSFAPALPWSAERSAEAASFHQTRATLRSDSLRSPSCAT
jgi:hypothetical protein